MKSWKTKDGREIPIGDLTDEHLLNIVAMLEKNIVYSEAWLKILKGEIEMRAPDYIYSVEHGF